MTKDERISMAYNFSRELYGGISEKKFTALVTIDNGVVKTYPVEVGGTDDCQNLAKMAIDLSDAGHNVFTMVNVRSTSATTASRGKEQDITLQTAVIVDIDVAGDAHKGTNLAESFDKAKSFLPMTPTMLVNSGHGAQAHYVFDTPLVITDDNRDVSKARNEKFLDLIRKNAGGCKIDGVADLCRVFRMPGTFNRKLKDNMPLCRIVENSRKRFSPADFDALLKPLETNTPTSSATDSAKHQKNITELKTAKITEYNLFRVKIALDTIANKNITEQKETGKHSLEWEQYIVILTACKKIGVPYDIVDEFNRHDPTGKYNTDDNFKRWQGLEIEKVKDGMQTILNFGRKYGYIDAEVKRQWQKIKGGFTDEDYDFYFDDDRSDLANARRLERFCADSIRWIDAPKDAQWLIWQNNGVWQRKGEKSSALLPMTARLYDLLAKNAHDEEDRKIADNFKRAGKTFAAISMLKSCDSILVTPDDLDTHSNLLNCLNGVVDLQTAKLYPHVDKRSAMLTQQVNAAYYPDAKSELVTNFFRDIQPDETTRNGLKRWLGYCLTGESSEEKFLVWYGSGSNGKGVLGGTLLELLNSYATGLPQRALLRKNIFADDADKATTSLNTLENARFALSEELPQGSKLNTELIKTLSGGDKINIRRNYGEYRTIRNYAKLNISGNFLPGIENVGDKGILRRLLNMPFNAQFGSTGKPANRNLKKEMLEPNNLSALLAILVSESQAWYRQYTKDDGGLIISEQMKDLTAQHVDTDNFVAEFLDDSDKFVRAKNATVKAKDFIDALKAAYPAETRLYRKSELIQLISSVAGIEYTVDKLRYRVFEGVGKRGDDFNAPPPSPPKTQREELGFDPNDLPFD